MPKDASYTRLDALKLIEYAAVIGSVAGSITTVVSKQFVYWVSPFMAGALFLNVVNRQRLAHSIAQSQRSSDSTISDIQTMVESLHDQGQSFQQQLQARSSEANELDSVMEVMTELQRATGQLQQETLRQQDWDVIMVKFKLLEEAVQHLKGQSAGTPPELTPPTSTEIRAYEMIPAQSPAEIGTDLHPSSELQTQVEHLQLQVIELDRQNRELVKPYLKRLTQAVKELQN
ncbi:MAG: hypothetical protein ACFBSC_06035 [Microcoleaceae cyanobacterium]